MRKAPPKPAGAFLFFISYYHIRASVQVARADLEAQVGGLLFELLVFDEALYRQMRDFEIDLRGLFRTLYEAEGIVQTRAAGVDAVVRPDHHPSRFEFPRRLYADV